MKERDEVLFKALLTDDRRSLRSRPGKKDRALIPRLPSPVSHLRLIVPVKPQAIYHI